MMKLSVIARLPFAALVLVACSESSVPEPQGEVKRYEARGRVQSVAASGDELTIFHEALPGFTDAKGQVVGMPAHPMSLKVGEDVDGSQVAAGDLISFTLCVQWEPTAKSWIEDIAKLPADTALDLGDTHGGHGHDHGEHHTH